MLTETETKWESLCNPFTTDLLGYKSWRESLIAPKYIPSKVWGSGLKPNALPG